MNHHHMELPLALKSVDASGRFAGYASVFGVVDRQGDEVVRGAFAATIVNREADIKLLWQHRRDEPIGIITHLKEDTLGLYVEGRLLLDIARAKEALALLKNGVLKGLSIGYSPLRYDIDRETGVRRLYEVALWEISLVTFPANESAQVTVVKASPPPIDAEWKQLVATGGVIALADALERAQTALLPVNHYLSRLH
jgi:uncharacterized protein